nr:MAG TPA: hypothetical protein [Bacteriophage sp.]
MNIKEYKSAIETLYKDMCENADLATKQFRGQSNSTLNTEWGRGYMDALETVLKILDDVKVVKPRTKKREPMEIQLDYIEDLYNFEEIYFGEKPSRERKKELFEQQIQCVIDICKEYYRPYDLVSIDELDD